MTDEPVLSKWDFIAKWLKELNAPKKVINAAIEVDDALIACGLGHNTCDWERDYDYITGWDRTSYEALFNLINTEEYCTACEDVCGICRKCKLGANLCCTPRSRHADKYFSIVRNWTEQRYHGIH